MVKRPGVSVDEPRMKLFSKLFLSLAALTAAFSPTARAEDPASTAAKKLFAEKQDAVVWISVVIKVSFSTEGSKDGSVNLPDREQKMEALGTFIETNGLLVTALSSIDPSREISGREFRGMKLEASTSLKEVRIIMPDGTEIPGEVLLRDVDLDLAFLRPKSGAKEARGVTFKAIDLKNSSKAGVADEVIALARTDEVLNRVGSVSVGQVTAVTRKPREFVRATSAQSGCPAFAVDGRAYGIGAVRFVRGKGSQTVVIPAPDVLELAAQALAAKPLPEDKSKPAAVD